MLSKRLLHPCAAIMAIGFVCCCVWSVLLHLNVFESDGVCVSVDGSRLRFSNSEFIVTNLLSISVRPTRKTSEWIYVYGADSEIWVNGHRLEIEKMGIKLFYNGGEKFADEEIKSELPVLLRFFEDKVIVAGVATWVHGQIVIENINGPYNVTIRVKKDCRVVVKGNWYEFTG